MITSNISLNDVVIAYAADPNWVIQVRADSTVVLFHLEEQSDRQRFVLSNTDPEGTSALWTISSVTGGVRITSDGENKQLLMTSLSTSETEWYIDGKVAFGETVRIKNRKLKNCFMTLKEALPQDGSAILACSDIPGPSQQWRLDKPQS